MSPVAAREGSAIEEIRRGTEPASITALSGPGELRSATADIAIATRQTSELVDVTDHVRAIVRDCEVDTGLAIVSTPHTTCAVIVNEAEPGFTADLEAALERLAPRTQRYLHDDAPHDLEFEEPNGYAHIRAAFLSSPSVSLPVREGALALGRWQRIFLVELDRGRPRSVQVTVLGRR